MSVWWAQYAWLGGDTVAGGVLIQTAGDRITGITQGVTDPPSSAQRLPGLTIPGLVNAHSHAFHRALRGRTQAERGSFWTWRERMYEVAARLQPENYYALARATLIAGFASSIENFNYVVSAVLTPLFLLAGTFFPLDALPRWAQILGELNPLHQCVQLVRDAVFMNLSSTDLLRAAVLVAWGLVLWRIAIYAMERKLID